MFRLIMQAIMGPKFNNFIQPLQVGVRSQPLKTVIHSKILRNNTRSLDRFIKCVILQKHKWKNKNITPISDIIYHLTDKFFGSCPAHPNPLIRSIGNYSLADLHRNYKKNE